MRLLRNVTYITHVYYNRPVTIPQLSIYRDVVGQVKLTTIYNLLNTIIYFSFTSYGSTRLRRLE